MVKKSTNLKRSKIANDLMSYIFDNIQTDINLDYLSEEFNINKFHLHRIFKEQMGTSIYETIKSIRLQKASNILITNRYSTITEIANMCGYSSQTSFIRAFKQRFNQTPKYWRNGGYKEYSNKILKQNFDDNCQLDFSSLKRKLVKVVPRMAYYLRQKGYTKNYREIWEKMTAWIYTNNIKEYEQIGIYHDNPTITPLQNCDYVACVVPKVKNLNLSNTNLPMLEIQECLCITFDIEGTHNDILKLAQWVYQEWLPNSGYEKITIPTYMILKKMIFLKIIQ
ncbi:AraC family transcriptional regulator [Halarcobacter anaerophilus]|uniref:AraC family transcriptional regulator n=1 Tax=Halarcobacter anaerophilus TaxID=877500 RepID=UPI001161EB56|nr:helix-turn-helix domain-containing protein [Halarcobacter anaerophilus]QDF28822.1 transcriptional regulator, AraC family (GyrI domain) [Halarcobacter anaerophilus]